MTIRPSNAFFRTLSLIAAGVLVLATAAIAEDWHQWRGPRRNGISAEKGWLAGWTAGAAPRVAWTAAVGRGHSAVSVSGDRAYTMGWDGSKDTVYCFDAATGKIQWKQSYPCDTIVQWPGPRATPTVDGTTVYTLGQHGQLRAFDAVSGQQRWGVQLADSYEPDVDYGFAWSPLVEGDLLILGAGSKGLALRKKDGTAAWGNDGQHGACASAVPYELNGKRGIALITTNPGRDSVSLVGVEPQTGKELWRYGPWVEKWGAACVDPLIHEGRIFITTAEQHLRCARFSIGNGKVTEDWSNRNLTSYTGSCVLVDGFIYAVNKLGRLKCLDWNTGEEKWSQAGFGTFGTLMAADGKLIVQTSREGDLVIVEATPAGYRELRRAKAFAKEADTFTVPVLSNGRLYCRSYAGELVCLDLTRR
jgi:outer membrane protein assembly factor BamB